MWPNLQFLTDLLTFTEKILYGKIHFYAVSAEFKDQKVVKLCQFFNSKNWQSQRWEKLPTKMKVPEFQMQKT